MKRVLSLVLVLVMVLGTIVPAFAEEATTTAAEMTAGEKLLAYGAIDGTENGLEEERPIKRAEMAVIYAQLNGKIADAQAWAFSPSFTDMEGHWAEFIVAYAEDQGWMLGDGAGSTFRPEDEMSAAEVNVMLMKVLGHPVVWETVTEDAAALGIDVTAADATQVLRGEVFGAMVVALDEMPLGSEVTLGSTLENLTGYEAPVVEVPVVDLAVESVTAQNLSTITVVFNKEVEKTSAETMANYTALAGTATLAADAMTVTLELNAAVAQQTEVDLTVENVKDLDGNKIAKHEETIELFDATIPVVTGIELTGPKTFEISFSEDMKTTGTVKVNNGVYAATPALDGSKIKVTLGAALVAGTYEVVVTGSTDHADYGIKSTTLELDYVKDETAVTVSVDKFSQTSVTIKFDREIDIQDLVLADFYHTFTSYQPDDVFKADGVTDAIAVAAEDWQDTLVLDFTGHPLPEGTVNLTVSDDNVIDAWGNKMAADAKLAIDVTVDTTVPTITKVEATDEDTVVVTFSEDVTPGTLADNFVIKDSDGEAIAETFLGGSAYADNAQTLELSAKLAGGTYTITVTDVVDKALEANKIVETQLAFEITDKTAAAVPTAIVVEAADEAVDITDAQFIYVTYAEDMTVSGEGSIVDVASYQLDGAALPTGSTVELFGSNKRVKITIPDLAATLVGNTRLAVGQVADASGNKIAAFSSLITISADAAPVVTAVKTTATNTVEITVNGILTAAPFDGIKVDGNGDATFTTVAAAAFVADATNNKTVITVTLDALDKTADKATAVADVEIVASKLMSETGKYMAAVASTTTDADPVTAGAQVVTPTETMAPAFVAPATAADAVVAGGGNNVITLTFDETAIDVSSDYAEVDLTVVYDGTTLVAGTDYTVANAGADATLELTVIGVTAGKTIVVSVSGADYIVDANANVIGDFTQDYVAE